MPNAQNVVTNYVRPPIPTRNFDWEAYVEGSVDVCDDPECSCRDRVKIGRGATEAEAIADLEEQLEG